MDRTVHEVVVDDDVLQSARLKQRDLVYTYETYKHPDVGISVPLHAKVLLIIVQHGAILCHHIVLEEIIFLTYLPRMYTLIDPFYHRNVVSLSVDDVSQAPHLSDTLLAGEPPWPRHEWL